MPRMYFFIIRLKHSGKLRYVSTTTFLNACRAICYLPKDCELVSQEEIPYKTPQQHQATMGLLNL